MTQLQTVKGLGFIAVTALALFIAINRYIGHVVALLSRVEHQRDQLQHVRERWTEAFDAIQDPIMLNDAEFRVVRCNLAYAAKAGLDVKQVIGQPYWECFPKSIRLTSASPSAALAGATEEIATPEGEFYLATCYPISGPEGAPLYALHVFRDTTRLARLTRALKTLREVNLALVRTREETGLLQEICRIAVETGGFALAWVGYAGQDNGQRIRPVAVFGDRHGYVAELDITGRDADTEDGSIFGATVRTGQISVINDISAASPGYGCLEKASNLGYRSMIVLPLREEGRSFGAIAIYSPETNAFDESEVALLKELAGDLAFGIITLHNETKRREAETRALHHLEKLNASMEQAIEAIALTVEKRDPYTAGHQKRVAELATAIARQMRLSDDRIRGIRLGSLIHDIGKIYVPAEILNRPGRLAPMELELIKTHTTVGYEILKGVDFSWPVAQMVLQHHERLDGSGYPHGLKGDGILLEARILAVADDRAPCPRTVPTAPRSASRPASGKSPPTGAPAMIPR